MSKTFHEYTSMEDLDTLISLGWGDVPQELIPPDVLKTRRRRTGPRYFGSIQHAEVWVMENSEPVPSPRQLNLDLPWSASPETNSDRVPLSTAQVPAESVGAAS